MSKIRSILLCLFVLHFAIKVSGQKKLTLSDIKEQFTSSGAKIDINLLNYVYLFEDKERTLKIEQIKSGNFNSQFKPFRNYNELHPQTFYWAKIEIDLETQTLVKLIFRIRGSDSFDVYLPTKNSQFHKKRTGRLVPTERNDEITVLSNVLLLNLEGNQNDSINTQTLFINFSSENNRPYFYLDIVDIEHGLEKTIQELEKKGNSNLVDGIFYGLLGLMFVAGMALFVLQKHRYYLFYSLYVFFISIFLMSMDTLIIEKVLFNHRKYEFFVQNASVITSIIFYNLFLRNVMFRQINLRKIRKFIAGFIYFILGLTIFILLEQVKIYKILIVPSGVILFVVYLTIQLKHYNKNEKISSLVAIGTLILYSSFLYLVLKFAFDLPSLVQVLQVGILCHVLFFAYILVYRIKHSEELRRKAQDKLISQLQENKKLQHKVNKELEQKVKERTRKIGQQNEELKSQYEEILTINTVLEEQRKLVEERNLELQAQNEEIACQRDKLNDKNKEIRESIVYAKRIQTAVLPRQDYIDEILHENFILFRPRNEVSGDFYWVRQVNGYIVIAVADCTGHGVPGAIMSMLGISFINEIIYNREITQCNEALNELRKQIKHTLRQTGRYGEADDGMDIAVCAIDTHSNKMQYAGANNSLYLIQNNEFIEIKADRMPIGYSPNEKRSFTNHEIQLKEGDVIYLSSDGFMDQFGGSMNHKYMSKNFKRKLLEIHNKPMFVQKELLDDELDKWMGGIEQTDDILVMGVRV